MRLSNLTKNYLSGITLAILKIIFRFIQIKLMITIFGDSLNGLFISMKQILAYSTLLEAGAGGSIIYYLYKPISEKDYKRANEILAGGLTYFDKIAKRYVLFLLMFGIIYPYLASKDIDISPLVMTVVIFVTGLPLYFSFKKQYIINFLIIAANKTYINNVYNIILSSLELLVLFLMLKIKADFIVLIFAISLLNIFAIEIYVLFCKRLFKWFSEVNNADMIAISQTKYAVFHKVMYMVDRNTDGLLLSIFNSFSSVTYYGIYNSIYVGGIDQFLGQFSKGFQGKLGKDLANEKKNYESFLSYRFFTFIVASIMLGITILMIYPFIKIYVGMDYVDLRLGVLFMVMFLLESLKRPNILLITATGRFKQTRSIVILQCVVNVVLSIFLIIKMGLIGAVIATITASLISYTLFVKHTYFDYFRNSDLFKKVVAMMIVNLLPIILATALSNLFYLDFLSAINSLVQFTIVSLIVGIIYSLFVLIINWLVFKKDMKLLIKDFIK